MRANYSTLVAILLVAACDPSNPNVLSISPTTGSVAGGTRLTIEGADLGSARRVSVAGIECLGLAVENNDRIHCTTGATRFVDTIGDVVVETDHGVAELPRSFTYECPWQTSTGRRSCGAAPPLPVASQPITSWVVDIEEGHAFTATGPGATNLEDTMDFVLGARSAWIETDGAGSPRLLATDTLPGLDMTRQLVKVWLKVDNLAAVSNLELRLGDADLQSFYSFRLSSTQGQQWLADGEWIAISLAWAADTCGITGTPDRANIRGAALRVIDNASGTPVRVHLDGIALVPEPIADYPRGVLSFTFDDNHADMVAVAAPLLARHAFPATAYAIIDLVDRPKRATLAELRDLQARGWDIAAHAFTSSNHDARFPTLPLEVVEDELVDTRAWLMTNGFTAFDHCAYPGGDFSRAGNDVTPIAARYFTSCRTIYQRQREAVPPADAMKLRVLYVTSATPLETVTVAVDHARDHHEWIILVFHKLTDAEPTVLTEWPTSHFAALVEHVAASGIRVEPVSRVLAPTH